MKKKAVINSARDAVSIARDMILDKNKEHFFTICLNSRNKVNKAELVSLGCVNSCLVHPLHVFRRALITHSIGIVTLHNHPSNDVSPSAADLELTERLKKCGEILGIEILDSIIFDSRGNYKSIIDENYN